MGRSRAGIEKDREGEEDEMKVHKCMMKRL